MALNNVNSPISLRIGQTPNTGDSKLDTALIPVYNAIRQLQSSVPATAASSPVSSTPVSSTPTPVAIVNPVLSLGLSTIYGLLKSIGGSSLVQAIPSVDYAVPQNLGVRNRIHNGDFRIDQGNVGAVQTFTAGAALSWCVDRYYGYCTGADITGQQIQLASGQFRYKLTGASSNTGLGIGQRIEAKDCLDLAGSTTTLQVLLSSSSITSVTWTAYYANTSDTFGSLASPTKTLIATGTFTISSTEALYSTNISIPSAALTGIEIVLSTGALVASQTLQIGNMQFEPGSTPTPFEWIPYAESFMRCARRCFALRCLPGSIYSIFSVGFGNSTTQASFPFNLPTPMPYMPVITVGNIANMYLEGPVDIISLNSIVITYPTTLGFCLNVNVTSGVTKGAAYALRANNSNLPYLILRAELQ